MADCSYARCVQQRRNIRRELQRWTKNMVHIVGLERIAEELMGRRKWKLYQESMSRNYLQPLNNNINRTNPSSEDEYHHHNNNTSSKPTTTTTTTLTKSQQFLNIDSSEKNESSNNKIIPSLIDSNISRDINEKESKEYQQQQKENKSAAAGNDIKQELLEDRLKDWSPQTKCYFCVDGKLDSEHSAHGVLSPRHSDSESSESPSDSEAPPSLTPSSSLNNNIINNNNNNHHHHHQQQQQHHHRAGVQHPVTPANMTTIESVTSMAALAAVAALTGGNSPVTPAPHLPFYAPNIHNWYLANMARTFQQQQPDVVVDKVSGSGGEQPLDLSKGGSGNTTSIGNIHFPTTGGTNTATITGTEQKIGNNVNARLPTLDTKHIYNSDFRAKPRMSAVAGRRTYTEDELQAALRDIQSGKLGTRRAAVIYGIPRSTLRNKVYKLALERERESHLVSNTPLKLDEEEVMDDEKELSGAEEEKEVEKALQGPLVTMADIIRFSNMENPPEALKNMLQKTKEGQDIWAGLEHSEIGPYIQSILLASQNLLANQKLNPDGSSTVLNNMVPELMKRMMVEEQLLKMQQHNNGDSNNEKMMRPSPSNSVVSKTDKDKSRSESDMETEESSSNVILKIPSFKPTSSKNGCDLFPRNSIEVNSMVSPPVSASESGSPPILPNKGLIMKDVKDVIAQSISQKFQQTMEPRRPIIDMDYKRFTPPLNSGISVIKSQSEINRQYQPQQQQQQHQKPSQSSSSGSSGGGGGGGGGSGGNSSNSATGGKGTRPKRGKYRNYDRDSLVEAVRAVQRGEMSVHRAGSYYGVPHSTLEYKVKERHLMRPRKRDPKPNPVDEKIASLKQNDLRNTAQDKLKVAQQQPVMKPPQKFSPTSPNGIKLPLFESAGMPPLSGYNHPPFPFWAHPSFPAIPLDYGRTPTSTFPPPNPEFFASQMMQKLQEESTRTHNNSNATNTPSTTPTLAKSARQMAESLLDGTGSNGSFLDGIIRSSLESGVPTSEEKSLKEEKNLAPENMSNKALLEQLCRNSRLTPLSKPNTMTSDANSSGDESYRKGPSPINFSTGASSHDDNMDSTSSPRQDKENSDLHTIELSNDSNDSNERKLINDHQDEQKPPPATTQQQPPARIYLKQDLVKPENLKPEMLVRFRDVLPTTDIERNGISESVTESASDNDTMSQD